MGKGHSFFAQMIENTDLAPESVPGQPIIEIAGDRRVLIENHQGVAAYGRNQILVKVRYGSVCICGCNLEMLHMTKEQLVICGRIDSVGIQRRKPI